MVEIEKDKCEKCLGNYGTFVAELVRAEEFAHRDETDRALERVRWASEAKKRMDDLGCLMSAESKITASRMAKLGDAVARKDKREVINLARDADDHLLKALRFILCGE